MNGLGVRKMEWSKRIFSSLNWHKMSDVPHWLQSTLALAALLLGAGVLQWVLRATLGRLLERLGRKAGGPLAVFLHRDVLRSVSFVVLPLVTHIGVRFVPRLPEMAKRVIENVALALTVLVVARTLLCALDAVLAVYAQRAAEHGRARPRSVKMYVQFGQLFVWLAAFVIVIAVLSDKSPLIVLSGFGAMSAVVLFIFQDTIRSFVAGMQIENNDILRVGDWIEMPQADADGFVIDVALNTVKVQNWDKTIVAIPTWKLMSESFKNWRGMSESGGRRIKRALQIDANSVRFLTDEEIVRLSQIKFLSSYMQEKHTAVRISRAMVMSELGEDMGSVPLNQLRLTNIGTYRAYVQRYLEVHHFIRKDMWLLARMMDPTETGVPIEVYCYANTTNLEEYEAIQSDIFDHLLAILPEFGLRVFQGPSDNGLRDALAMWQPRSSATSVVPATTGASAAATAVDKSL